MSEGRREMRVNQSSTSSGRSAGRREGMGISSRRVARSSRRGLGNDTNRWGRKEDKKGSKEGRKHTVRRENTQMTTPNKLFIIQSKDRIIRIQEFRMEYHFNPIARPIE
jgi:hypothetical protein